MSQLVILNLAQGNLSRGCPTVIAQLWQADRLTPMQFLGSLPAAPELGKLYERWQQLYAAFYAYKSWRQRSSNVSAESNRLLEIEIDEEDEVTQFSVAEFEDLCQEIQQCLNQWLNAPSFHTIDRQLRTYLVPTNEIRLIVSADDRALLRLPWHLWQFFEDYSRAELALSLPEYTHATQATVATSEKINILAILGNQEGINIDQDQHLLEQLPHTNLKLLLQPNINQLNEQLWQQSWDLLFFAGHSSSQGKGTIQINRTDSLTIDQLRYGLKRAIASGLKLAVFNSCDGLRLAWDLADLQIPQVIVMREPVPDQVAQAFLKYFLIAFSGGQPLYLAVRQAREQLQALEVDFPCATWLPVICQNPAEVPQTWQEWRKDPEKSEKLEQTEKQDNKREKPVHPAIFQRWRQIVCSSLLVTGCLLGVRSLGILQPLELWAYDRLLTLRPAELPDDRFLIVRIDEADIQAQDASDRRGSLSDKALNQLLEKLEPARVIGLDIYRDFSVSPAVPQLAKRLQQERRLFVVCKSTSGAEDPTGIAPPPEVAATQIGFSDFLADEDGILRRHLLLHTPDPTSPCTAPYAFNMQLAFSYLDQAGVSAAFTPEGNLIFNNQSKEIVLHRLKDRTGGYQSIDARGNQILLNYRSRPSPEAIAPQVSLTRLLSGQISPTQIKDRIVLIGVTAGSNQDTWLTPYGNRRSEQVAGVFLQAHMTSQVISAVLDDRPLLRAWTLELEAIWIWGWTIGTGVLMELGRHLMRSRAQVLVYGGLGGVALLLAGASLLLLIQGTWVPLLPAGIGVGAMGSMSGYLSLKPRK
ncbi:CHASE2 domain-containing protein [Phormidium tenue FACHB-886]|nr:CHASE2 domain-containing protein [Phormidium tenue FACHB-886]